MPPDNANFYHAAYAVAIAVYGLYAVLLRRRRVRVREALAQLAEMDASRADA